MLATITLEGEWALVRFPYDPKVVAALKDELPTRRWDPDDRAWEVPSEYAPLVEKILARFHLRVQTLNRPNPVDWVEEVFSVVSGDNARILYLGLSKAFHPDQGGDPEIMRRINDAYHGAKV